jgi:NTP pyrophosphatase (non-canonical NTP hydrolase)
VIIESNAVTFDGDGTVTYGSAIVAGVLAQLTREGWGYSDYRPHWVYAQIRAELERAYTKHGREPWGRHEFYGILLEEVDELWDAIKGDEPMERVHAEAIQVAAMVFRYIETGDRYGYGASPAGAGSSSPAAAGGGPGRGGGPAGEGSSGGSGPAAAPGRSSSGNGWPA